MVDSNSSVCLYSQLFLCLETCCVWTANANCVVGTKNLRKNRLNLSFSGSRSVTIGAMTTIIGIQGSDGCVLAADSRTTGETGRPYCHEYVEKITERGPYMIACSGDADACDIIQHQWDPPKPPKRSQSHYKFMVTEVSTSIKKCLKNKGYEKDKSDKEAGFLFLIALNGTLYELDETCTVSMRDDGIYGIGSGSKYAIGALQAGADWNRALLISEKNDIYTSRPFIYRRQVKI